MEQETYQAKGKIEQETYQASDLMKQFFIKLLTLKEFVREELKKTNNDPVLKEIVDRLDNCIKEAK